MRASTQLSNILKHQGCLISIRKKDSRRKRESQADSAAIVKHSSSDEQDCLQPQAVEEETKFASSSKGYKKSCEEDELNNLSISPKILSPGDEGDSSLRGQLGVEGRMVMLSMAVCTRGSRPSRNNLSTILIRLEVNG